jgi:hypothetical protein
MSMLPLLLDCWTTACDAIVQLNCIEIQRQHKRISEDSVENVYEINEEYDVEVSRKVSKCTTVSDDSIDVGKKTKRHVSFTANAVFLVPNRNELFSETLKEKLWYNSSNIGEFRKSAMEEVEYCMKHTGIVEIRRAFRCLYQPPLVYQAIYSDSIMFPSDI